MRIVKQIQRTFFDLIEAALPAPVKEPPAPRARRARDVRRQGAPLGPSTGMAVRYETLTRDMLRLHGVRVRKWRSSMSGVAWEVIYEDGQVVRLIEAPRPKGPMSAAVFLHEIGHHAIGFNRYRPRCLEEYHAWAWAIEQMEKQGVSVTDSVRKRVRDSLRYAVRKARRRGIKAIPHELAPFL